MFKTQNVWHRYRALHVAEFALVKTVVRVLARVAQIGLGIFCPLYRLSVENLVKCDLDPHYFIPKQKLLIKLLLHITQYTEIRFTWCNNE